MSNNTSDGNTNPGEEVQLAIYDLSHGMARSLSLQFLGPDHAIDIIPHTGIIVFGKEYFFGSMGGIECLDPSQFRATRNIHPIETKLLGRTGVKKDEFDNWCLSQIQSGMFSGSSYDLLQRNCNNFCHQASLEGLRLNQGIPDWILNVPQRFLSSPMGQMMRPMLEQMQLAGPSGDGSSFASQLGTTSGSNVPNSSATTITTTSGSATVPTSSKTTSSSTPGSENRPIKKMKHNKFGVGKTPTLDSYHKPLISSDTRMVPLCVKKIKNGKGITIMSSSNQNKKEELCQILDELSSKVLLLKSKDDKEGVGNDKNTKEEKERIIRESMNSLLSFASQDDENIPLSEKTFSLMLIRLLVLHETSMDSKLLFDTIDSIWERFIVGSAGTTGDVTTATNIASRTTALKSMAWCILSNFIASTSNQSSMLEASLEKYVDSAIADLELTNAAEIRQASSAFLYNLTLQLQHQLGKEKKTDKVDSSMSNGHNDEEDELSDLTVAILCGISESLSPDNDENNEKDFLTLTRKLLVIGKFIRSNDIAASLLVNLGHKNVFEEMTKKDYGGSGGEKISKLAADVFNILSNVPNTDEI